MPAPDLSSPTTSAICVSATTLWTDPEAPREIDGPILGAVPDPRRWPAVLDVEARLDLTNRILTQLLLGEPVEVVEERGDWLHVIALWQPSERHPRGYPGWVPRAHVAAGAAPAEREAVIAVEAAPLRAEAGPEAAVTGEVSYATILPVLDESAAGVRVGLPGGRSGWLDPSSCVVRATGADHPVDGHAVLSAARRFVGLDYLWGGMNAFGLDCSGIVHLSFRALGRVVPRDAHDQAAAAARLPVAEAKAGDLLFFARPGKSIHHVGFATGKERWILHAPKTGRQVSEEPMDDDRDTTLVDLAGRLAD
ncbi:NlpC/P60 family protein [Actinopolymorpha alba]|uniref:C40 family peptidase n=1 Tax=Actinopolymorpha alba TaxID=533267 RepID=UPI00037D811F|nr:NlpC/P60 family protein [Actinopolymorpha alba]